jgi:two-component system chemotaxis response regulator CheB
MTLALKTPEARPSGARARVVICDDSAVVRTAIGNILRANGDIEIVARVGNGLAAIEAVKQHNVDVVVLDIEMPVMDGLTALPLLLAQSPQLRVIIASNLTTRGAKTAFRALGLGAADTLAKPSAESLANDQSFALELVAKVLGLSRLSRSEKGEASTHAAQPAPRHRPCSPSAVPPVDRMRCLHWCSRSGRNSPCRSC